MSGVDRGTAILGGLTGVVVLMVMIAPGNPIGNTIKSWWTAHLQRRAVEKDLTLLEKLGHPLTSRPTNRVIFEFADYECPYCRSAEPVLTQWMPSHPDVAVVYLNYPLGIHEHANAAARAAECAAEEGRFVEMHHELMSNSAWLADTNWRREAVSAGVRDTDRFLRCLTDSAIAARVDSAVHLGGDVGVQATPTFIGNDTRIVGVPSPADLDRLAGVRR